MPNFEKKEKYEGIWNGEAVAFNRVYSGHRLTDEECEALLRGETIIISGLVSAKGNEYAIKAKLDHLEFNGHGYVGVNRIGFATSGLPKSYCQHTFTDDERMMLERGEKVKISGYVSKKGSTFDAVTSYDDDKGISFHFDDNK